MSVATASSVSPIDTSGLGLSCPPTWLWHPPYEHTRGPLVAKVCELAGFAPDPAQRLILDLTFAHDDDGFPVCYEVVIIGPRQQIKTGALKQIALGNLLVLRAATTWTAQLTTTTDKSFADLERLTWDRRHAEPSIRRRFARPLYGKGEKTIRLADDHEIALDFAARSTKSGRGDTKDKNIVDEALFVRDEDLAALLPTMTTRPLGQVVYASSAGLATSKVLRRLRDRGRAGGEPRLAYLEWGDPTPGEGCADPECDHERGRTGCVLDDRAKWYEILPGLAVGRGTEQGIADLRSSLTPETFAREMYGWWDDPAAIGQKITLAQWTELEVEDEEATPTGELHLAVDASPGLASASIVAFGGAVMELVERKPGVWWLTERLVELRDKHSPAVIAVDPSGPIGALIPEMQTAGLDLTILDGKDAARAPVSLVRAVTEKTFRHGGESEFAAAVEGARWKEVGDGLRLSRKDSTVDITPMVAAAVALWVATEEPDYDVLQSAW